MTPSNQPVRFYKFVALTFLFITIILSGVIMFMSSKRATIIIESKAAPVDINDSIPVGNGERPGSLKGEVATAFITLDKTFYPTGARQEEANAAGVLTIYNDSNASQQLIATTRLLSADNVLFRLKEGVVVPAYSSVEAEVYADEKGEKGNAKPTTFIIPGLNEARQKAVYAVSAESMSGGIREIGILSDEDINKAEEVLKDLLREKGAQELSAGKTGLAGVYLVIQDSYESNAAVGEEVSEFSLSGKATILAVFYDPVQLQGLAENIIAKRAVDDTEIIQPSQAAPTATIEAYDLEKGTAVLQVFYDGVAVFNPESKQLEKSMVFGKTKDEIRRYLLKLDHIRSVEIKFTPGWIRTVPFVGEHVNVMVKEVN